MTTTAASLVLSLDAAVRRGLDVLLLSIADDEFVLGFSDSEWTGIAPMLEEDVAMSSLALDEIGHARALYELLAEVRADGRDADAIAYDRSPDEYRHCRLVDGGRGDWAMTMARRYLYDTADAARLDALSASSWAPLAELVAKLRREEKYHVMHVSTWLERLARGGDEARGRLLAALARLAPDAATVFTPLPGETALVAAGILAIPLADAEARWRASITPDFIRLELPMPPPAVAPERGRLDHSDAFSWLWGEFTTVRRLDPEATW
jgi:ring-1,2-phenylacetyl-CoA epoxidase subunit PaaC